MHVGFICIGTWAVGGPCLLEGWLGVFLLLTRGALGTFQIWEMSNRLPRGCGGSVVDSAVDSACGGLTGLHRRRLFN